MSHPIPLESFPCWLVVAASARIRKRKMSWWSWCGPLFFLSVTEHFVWRLWQTSQSVSRIKSLFSKMGISLLLIIIDLLLLPWRKRIIYILPFFNWCVCDNNAWLRILNRTFIFIDQTPPLATHLKLVGPPTGLLFGSNNKTKQIPTALFDQSDNTEKRKKGQVFQELRERKKKMLRQSGPDRWSCHLNDRKINGEWIRLFFYIFCSI